MTKNEILNVLAFWRAVEALSPQQVKTSQEDNNREAFWRAVEEAGKQKPLPNELLPLQQGHKHQSYQSRKNPSGWIVQCGLYEIRKLVEKLVEKVSPNMKVEERKKLELELDKLTGKARLFDLHFNKDGCPLPDTFALALNAWASGVILQRDGLNKLRDACSAASLSGYEQFDNIKNRLVEYIKDSKQQTGITKEWLNQLIGKVAEECKFPQQIIEKEEKGLYLVKALPVYNQNNEAEMNTDDSLINSFFIGELYKVAKEWNHDSGRALLSYFTGSQGQKIDVRGSDEKSQNEVREIIKPQSFPVGCWPSKYPLVFSQQLAVNAIRNEFIANGILKEGLFAVNGPPGTGKTTLLRDIVAMVVVERALKLYNERKGIFESQAKKVNINNKELEYFPLVEYLRDYSIVVASSNNGAVENVSLELPRMVSVSEAVKDHDYFRDIATMLLNKNNVEDKAWGLIATNLGRKENRNKFIGTFWATEQTSRTEDGEDIQSEQQIQETISDEQISSDILQELKSWLSQWEGRWSEVQKELLKWVEEQRQCGKKVLAQDILLRTQKSFEQELQKVCELVSLLEQELAPRCEQSPESGTAGNCSAETAPVATSGLSQRLLLLRKGEARPKISREQALTRLEITLEYEQFLRKQVETKATENNQLYSQDEETREKSAPFFDETWFAIRQDLFLAALNLHRALIEEQPDKWLKLLRIVRTWLEGKPLPPQTCQHALDALCFIVPVISTTFASVGRMLANIGERGIGWLLIDEAGQAAPQQAVGAIWRARRVIVVGDPLQLEPVVTLPEPVEEALAKHFLKDFQTATNFRPTRSSVQILADCASKWGTNIEYEQMGEQKSIWVGCPLRVHRRCDKPMFSISNEIAYGGLMIYGKESESCDLSLLDSTWIDVSGQPTEGHWIGEEGKVLDDLIAELKKKKDHCKDIYLLSPFRSVATKLREKAKRYKLDCRKAGTIHTAQGKEADIVILVLGGGSQRAKEWAAEKPNLLNVAVTRAKKRLYVIGNKSKWGSLPYFTVLATRLESWNPKNGRIKG